MCASEVVYECVYPITETRSVRRFCHLRDRTYGSAYLVTYRSPDPPATCDCMRSGGAGAGAAAMTHEVMRFKLTGF